MKYSIAVLFILTASLFSSLTFSTQNSHAALITKAECESAGGTYIPGNPNQSTGCNFNYSPDNKIRSYSYYNALSQCGRMGQWQNQISDANATDPTKWLGGNSISVGYLVDSGDGERECNKMIRDALTLWGFSGNFTSALEEFGYERKTLPTYGQCSGSYQNCGQQGESTSWVRSTDNNTFVQAFQNGVKKRVGQGSAPTLEGQVDLLYRRSIFHLENAAACNAKPFKKVSELTADEKTKYPNNNNSGPTSSSNPSGWKDYLIVKLVNGENWKTEDWVYTLPRDNFIKVIKLNEAPGGGSVQKTCVVLAREHAEIADRVARDAASIILNNQDPSAKYGSIISTPGGSGTSGDAESGEGETESASSCTVAGVGWIVCPVMTFLGGLVDAAYNFVGGLLEVQPILTTGGTAGLYAAWQTMQTIANVAFVIAFLFIIFSQLTSVGVSNYGVKKMLPRLVIAAILVNISYWICAIAVDLSNILGVSMVGAFAAVSDNIQIPVTNLNSGIAGEIATGAGWTGIVGTVLTGAVVGGAMYYVGLSALIPALLAAFIAIITVFLVLTLRQALIILLIVVAPLAFVAYLLPNTEDLFTKWRKLLTTLLLMYPIIAGIFGASSLASIIVMNSSQDTIIQIMGAAIAILPLAITPIVMKTAGGVLNRFAGIVNNTEKGPIDRLRKTGEKYREGRLNIRKANALNGANQLGRGALVRWRSRRQAIFNGRESEANRANVEYVANQSQTNDVFRNAQAGGTIVSNATPEANQRALAGALNATAKLEADEVSAASAIIKNANLGLEAMHALAQGKNEYTVRDQKTGTSVTYSLPPTLHNSGGSSLQTAAIQEVFKQGDVAKADEIVSNSANYGQKQRQTIASGAQSLSSKVKYYGGDMGDRIASGQIKSSDDLDSAVLETIKGGKIGEADLASQDKDALSRISTIAAANPSEIQVQNLRQAALDLEKNDDIYPTVAPRNKARIEAIKNGVEFK